jgi:F-type H+-transporting ATPase subunit alpha
LTELLKQAQYSPFTFEKQAVSIWMGVNGKLDDIPTADIHRFETEVHDYISEKSDVFDEIRKTEDFSDETAKKVGELIDEYKKTFLGA